MLVSCARSSACWDERYTASRDLRAWRPAAAKVQEPVKASAPTTKASRPDAAQHTRNRLFQFNLHLNRPDASADGIESGYCRGVQHFSVRSEDRARTWAAPAIFKAIPLKREPRER